MNYTTNYNLPQWEDTDVVTREDVNGAMASIDSAIANASPLVKLLDYTSPSATTSLTVDLSGIDFTQYWQIFMYVDIGTRYSRMRLNGVSSGYQCYSVGVTNPTAKTQVDLVVSGMMITFCPVHNGNVSLSTCSVSPYRSVYDYATPVTWANWNSITLFEDTLPAGSKVVMYGVRK